MRSWIEGSFESKFFSWLTSVQYYLLGWLKKTRFWDNQLLFDVLNLYVEKKDSGEGCGLYDDI